MRNSPLAALALVALGTTIVPAGLSAQAQGAAPARQANAPVITQALLRDIGGVERKVVGLAEAIPEEKYGWRPMEGVRSVLEVVQHVAADNYFMPAAAGMAAPAATGITAEYPTAAAYEKRKMTKAEAVQALKDSFAFLRTSMGATDQAFLEKQISAFGGTSTGLTWWVMTTSHLHEHLGQLIAYARSNNVVPPWSR